MDAAAAAELERAVDGPLTVDITTTGRRSGEPRRIEIWIVKVGERLVIGGTPGRRDWWANLQADPRLVVHLKDDVVADLPATATPVTDAAIRAEIWNHLSTDWYRGQTPVEELIASAPTVELSFD
ncbi:MAG: nitroreductase family deazaflavin-dependent oxidoreductase [Ilumatobacter sp.]